MADPRELYKQVGAFLNDVSTKYNFQVAKTAPAGIPSSDKSGGREYRMQLVNLSHDTSEKYKEALADLIRSAIPHSSKIKFNKISPNSSKYSSVSFSLDGQSFDIVIAKGANKGEGFEKKVVSDLQAHFSGTGVSYQDLISQMIVANPDFAKNEIKQVKQRTGNTRKAGIPTERLGEVIGDIVLTDSANKHWYISLKDVNGDTFSSFSGAASLFDAHGTLVVKSEGAQFLKAFGADLNAIQQAYDKRAKIKKIRPVLPSAQKSPTELKAIFERAWGMNYFYVRRQTSGWKVFWLSRQVLNKLIDNLHVREIRYPDQTSKQISIFVENQYAKYLVEVRNSKGGEYPNDTKLKIKNLQLK